MQADLFTGPLINQKLSGKECLNLKETQKSSRQELSRSNCDSENFLEIIFQLTTQACKDRLKDEKTIDALREILGDDLSESFFSELLPYVESLEPLVDYGKQKGELDTLLLAFQKMIGLDSSWADQSALIKKELFDLKENISLKNGERQPQFLGEKISLVASQNSPIGSISEAPDVIDENIDFEIGEDQKKESSDQSDVFKLNTSKSQKNNFSFNEAIDVHRDRLQNQQSTIEEKNIFEEKKYNIQTSESSNPDKNIGLDKTDDNSKVRVVLEEKSAEKSKPFLSEIKSSLNTSQSDSNGDTAFKFNSEKISSTIVETKSFSRPSQLNQTEIIQQIVEKAKLNVNKDHNEISIKLKPEILGNIRLNISTENHHVTIRVMAESPTVKEILENNLHHLRNGFVHQGLEIGSFDVMVGDQPQDFYRGQNFSGFQRGRRQTAETKKFVLNEVEEGEELSISSPYRSMPEKDRIDYYA